MVPMAMPAIQSPSPAGRLARTTGTRRLGRLALRGGRKLRVTSLVQADSSGTFLLGIGSLCGAAWTVTSCFTQSLRDDGGPHRAATIHPRGEPT
jgi:hypothetical protein